MVALRWRFWRRDASVPRPQEDPPAPGTRPLPDSPTAPRAVAQRDDDPDRRRPTSPFSGATPDPGRGASLGGLAVGSADDLAADDSGLAADDSAPSLDAAGVRRDLADLVQAAASRDGSAADLVRQRLVSRGRDDPGVAALIALELLGDRLREATGFAPADDHPPGSEGLAVAAAVAQGDLVAGRAAPLMRAVAAHCPRDLVRAAVRRAAGDADDEPALLEHLEARAPDLALVAAVLLAQLAADGIGDHDDLLSDLAKLLPDP